MNEWGDKEPDVDAWHHRGHPPGPHRGRMHGEGGIYTIFLGPLLYNASTISIVFIYFYLSTY